MNAKLEELITKRDIAKFAYEVAEEASDLVDKLLQEKGDDYYRSAKILTAYKEENNL